MGVQDGFNTKKPYVTAGALPQWSTREGGFRPEGVWSDTSTGGGASGNPFWRDRDGNVVFPEYGTNRPISYDEAYRRASYETFGKYTSQGGVQDMRPVGSTPEQDYYRHGLSSYGKAPDKAFGVAEALHFASVAAPLVAGPMMAASGAAAAGASAGSSAASEALGSGLRMSGGNVGLQASSTLGLQATPTAVAAFDSGINLSAAGSLGLTSSGTSSTGAARAPAPRGGIGGTGVSVSDVASGLSAASMLAGPKMPELPGPEEVPTREDVMKDAPKTRTEQFETRAQDLRRAAAAAGAQRSDNEADMLGVRRKVKTRGAARTELYGDRF